MSTASEIINRILELKSLATDAKLAELWSVSPTTISTWRNRNSVPHEKIITFCREEGLSLEYIFWGEGYSHSTSLTSLEEKLIQALRVMSGERREAIFHTVIGQATLTLAEKQIKADEAKKRLLLDAIQEVAKAIGE